MMGFRKDSLKVISVLVCGHCHNVNKHSRFKCENCGSTQLNETTPSKAACTCPTCGGHMPAHYVAKGYQCDNCADVAEGLVRGY